MVVSMDINTIVESVTKFFTTDVFGQLIANILKAWYQLIYPANAEAAMAETPKP